jgi:DNA-directed RNA polymerase specialized sigma24 family protein
VQNPIPFPSDHLLVQRCLEGNAEAICELQRTYRPLLLTALQRAGAMEAEAEEVADWLWADGLAPRPGAAPRLANYGGACSLKTWLYPLALNRWLARKRSDTRWARVIQPGLDVEKIETPAEGADSEAPLLDLMREALQAAFQQCSARSFVLLQFTQIDQLYLSEVARMFGCSKSKIDRDLEAAGAEIAAATMRYIHARDPWLELKWTDFLELCRVASPEFFGVE